ncbi:hypothetical protein [Deinococcus ruber]|uniref:Uncharacterized protein n=1 Tax=Deinococcus ruber TaxID=1848197 RepID=A0A918FAR8_9DEIO|nr:hypothetical protein [Deinococcus ruber]GGR16923.1 hypothetical protein GCM10008957_31950 [Deinococcus ruber]
MAKQSVGSLNSMLSALSALFTATSTIEIYAGTQPANVATAISTQTKLVTLSMSAPAFGAPANAVLTANAIANGTAIASGTATFARIKDGSGTAIMDLSVGTTGAEINFNSTAFVSGGVISITSMTLTQPGL